MPHFLIREEEIKDSLIRLVDKENLFHLTRVLRIKPNEKVKFIDKNHIVYTCEVKKTDKNCLEAKILSKEESARCLNINIVLVQSVLMTDAQNLLIANATQTGVKKIYPVLSDNVSVSKKNTENRSEKWQKIVLENFKQCERADMAEVLEVGNLLDTIKRFDKKNVLIFAEKYENSTVQTALKDVDKTSAIAVVIGPEGGFSEKEFEYFKKENYKLITLGKMIYKAPNAVIAALSNVISRLEDV